MSDSIASEQPNQTPERPLKEIAADILYYPMDLPPSEAFDSSKRKSDSPAADHFKNLLQVYIDEAPENLRAMAKRPSLLKRLQGEPGPLPKALPQEPNDENEPIVRLANSVVPIERLRDTLQRIVETGKAEKADAEIIHKISYPIVQLCAQSQLQMAIGHRECANSMAQ